MAYDDSGVLNTQFKLGDFVCLRIREPRMDNKEVWKPLSYGVIIEIFNAWSPAGDRWQYLIQTKDGKFIPFHEGFDVGTISKVEESKW